MSRQNRINPRYVDLSESRRCDLDPTRVWAALLLLRGTTLVMKLTPNSTSSDKVNHKYAVPPKFGPPVV